MEHKPMSKKEAKADMKEFNKRPGEAEKLKAIRKKNREMVHGKGVITRGKNAGLKKGTGTQKHSKEDLAKANEHMKKHGG
jgi:hypothetical protein